MYLKQLNGNHLVEVLAVNDLFNPLHHSVIGRSHFGEEMQDPEKFDKSDLVFPSGESLPECWVNDHYREKKAVNG